MRPRTAPRVAPALRAPPSPPPRVSGPEPTPPAAALALSLFHAARRRACSVLIPPIPSFPCRLSPAIFGVVLYSALHNLVSRLGDRETRGWRNPEVVFVAVPTFLYGALYVVFVLWHRCGPTSTTHKHMCPRVPPCTCNPAPVSKHWQARGYRHLPSRRT